ncbi:MAG TPA: UDP-3-O-(3-hydroxymyristoyl)glucosamine N-acyltransferase [Terriglobales bacterium]|nr:UDP-3-O-(3-hydroxymyristoyl)glucosamine N-acyltransferase [Terriglobales bacterium]
MKLADIARAIDCELHGDGSVEIERTAPIDEAGSGDLTFVANPRYRSRLRTTAAAAVIVGTSEAEVAIPSLRAADPYLAFSRALTLFERPLPLATGIHPTAVIASTARLGADTAIGPYCIIGDGVVLGARACLDAHVVIYPEVEIGDDFRAFSHVTVRERVRIGNRVRLQSGTVIGGDGFGYVAGPKGIERVPQTGKVVLEDDVEVGCNATVDRATLGCTVVGRASKLDNLVMVAHGCSIGEGSMLAAQVGIAGSTRVGRYVRMGGQAGIAGHLEIGDGAQLAGKTGVTGDVTAGATIAGYPAEPIQLWRRISAALPRLPELLRRVRRLERHLDLA